MSNQKIQVGMLSETVEKLLKEYGEEVFEVLDEAVQATAKKSAKELRSSSATPRNTGKYAKSWTQKKDTQSRFSIVYAVCSRKPGLPHLLEYPHMLRNGKYSRPQVHIYPVSEKAGQYLQEEVRKRLT